MIASLAMYKRPELDAAYDRLWQGIRRNLHAQGLAAPPKLTQDGDPFEIWTHPRLVLAQSCGLPYRRWLHDRVSLIGVPDYGLTGCRPGYYRSALVVRIDDDRGSVEAFRDALFAYNQDFSQSGYAAAYGHVMGYGFWFSRRLETGSHANSARAVASGQADIAALDAVSWRLMQAYDCFSARLRVLDWTEETPGLPLIAAKGIDIAAVFRAVAAAIADMTGDDRDRLGLRSLVAIDKQAYLNITEG